MEMGLAAMTACPPRASGDEPDIPKGVYESGKSSPRQRG